MIRYTLKCGKDHSFDSWFKSAAAFDALQSAGQVTCPICGDPKVEKALMAPAVSHGNRDAAPVLAAPENDIEKALAEMRRQVEANSEYVGLNFAAEARAIHDGGAPARAIYGEAKLDEARALIEDGIPVAPLPFRPLRKSN